MNIAAELVRTLRPDLTDQQARDLVNGWTGPSLPPLSAGQLAAVRWTRTTRDLLDDCDAETVDRLLETLDRLRAGIAR